MKIPVYDLKEVVKTVVREEIPKDYIELVHMAYEHRKLIGELQFTLSTFKSWCVHHSHIKTK